MEQNVKKQLEDYKKLIEQKLDEYIPVEYPGKNLGINEILCSCRREKTSPYFVS